MNSVVANRGHGDREDTMIRMSLPAIFLSVSAMIVSPHVIKLQSAGGAPSSSSYLGAATSRGPLTQTQPRFQRCILADGTSALLLKLGEGTSPPKAVRHAN